MEVIRPSIESDVTGNNAFTSIAGEIVETADKRSDALQAVKQDPAVLEARIITANVQKPTYLHEYPATSDDSIFSMSLPSAMESFESIVAEQEAALLSLPPGLLDLLLKYADTLRNQRNAPLKKCAMGCAFCKKNGEAASWYTCHQLRDGQGRVRCPVLRGLRCPRCCATGDRAHTIKYCPQ